METATEFDLHLRYLLRFASGKWSNYFEAGKVMAMLLQWSPDFYSQVIA